MKECGKTLTEAELARCSPRQSGKHMRAYCPFHKSDNQRSLSVSKETGRFRCFACGAWGYMAAARDEFKNRRRLLKTGIQRALAPKPVRRPPPPAAVQPVRPGLDALVIGFESALAGSPGEAYLRSRGIPLEVARTHRIGYAPGERWPNRRGRCPHGRVVFPHTRPDGVIVNLYGRAVELDRPAPKALRHDHLPGTKGYFHASALAGGTRRAAVCEGPFDALSLLAAGVPDAVAIFGVDGWRWEWARTLRDLWIAFDQDETGRTRWKDIGVAARLRGIDVTVLDAAAFGGHKDLAAAWQAGVLTVPVELLDDSETEADATYAAEERAAIQEFDGERTGEGTASNDGENAKS